MNARSLVRKFRKAKAAFTSGAGLIAKSLMTPLPRATMAQRLASLPTTGLPVDAPVTIRWNDHLVPFIEAAGDGDLAFSIGHVQAHLRFAHVGMTRRLAQGRLAESFGPIAADIDASLRILDLGQAAAANAAALPPATYRWIQRYCDGLNHYQATIDRLPHEAQVLALTADPFTVEDVITMGRLVGNDINWLGWSRLLRYRHRADWPAIWAAAVHYGGNSRASFIETDAETTPTIDALLEGVGRSGSNAIAVSGARTPHGSALLAGDPHVGIFLPNLWMIFGLKSPSYHAVGLTLPGVPFLAIGRNPDIAWGATNMRSASSDLVGIGGLAPHEIETEEQTLRVRWARPRQVRVRRTAYGPVISDAPIFPKNLNGPIALSWMGHRVTDEISAMLEVSRAGDFETYRQALSTFGVSGQNFLYADRRGHIGQVMAVHLPERAPEPPPDPVLPPAACEGWKIRVTSAELPFAYDPPDGFLVSANNQPAPAEVLVGYQYAANDRIIRLQQLLNGKRVWTMADLAIIQRDVVRVSALRLRDLLLGHRESLTDAAASGLIDRLAAWDASYDADRQEPVLFEFLVLELADALSDDLGPLRGSEAILDILTDRLAALPPGTLGSMLDKTAVGALRRAASVPSWGHLHRLKLHHPLANLPLVGWRYPRLDPPASGSTTTLMKTAHDLVRGPHSVTFGANARHIFDLADMDANWFTILGGQDGAVGTAHAADQVPLWQAGDYVRVPLRTETVAAEFRHVTRLMPSAAVTSKVPAAA